MVRTLSIFLTAAFLFFCSLARAEETPIPAAPTRWVTDTVEFLSVENRQTLDKRLEHYEKMAGRKVAIWVGSTTGGTVLETWGRNAINAWKTREKAFGEGVVIFIMTEDRAIDIELAPGLEKDLPDDFVGQLIMEQIAPRLNSGDTNGALTAALDTLLPRLDKVPLPVQPKAIPQVTKTPETKAPENSTKTPAEVAPATKKPPNEITPDVPRKSNLLLFIALGVLILASTIGVGIVGWSVEKSREK